MPMLPRKTACSMASYNISCHMAPIDAGITIVTSTKPACGLPPVTLPVASHLVRYSLYSIPRGRRRWRTPCYPLPVLVGRPPTLEGTSVDHAERRFSLLTSPSLIPYETAPHLFDYRCAVAFRAPDTWRFQSGLLFHLQYPRAPFPTRTPILLPPSTNAFSTVRLRRDAFDHTEQTDILASYNLF